MNDFRTLDQVFAELERRADVASARTEAEPSHARSRPHRARVPLVAATVVAVAAVAGGVVLLSHPGGDHTSAPAGGPASTSPSTPASVTPPPATPATTPVTPPPSTSAVPRFAIPSGPTELARRFRGVLAGKATISVTETASEPGDPYIKGVLTAAGARGGYDFQILDEGRGSAAVCEDPGSAVCHVRRLPDGSSLAVGSEKVGATSAGGVLYLVNLVRPDGTSFLWHLSNLTDPKGAGPVLGTRPPLTTKTMAAILENGQW